jgi:hypothetical protein
MFNIKTVQPAVYQARLSICHKCTFFKKETGSCGTLKVFPPFGETVTYYRRKIKLCGCVVKWKVKYRLSSCPAGKWSSEALTKAEVAELREFVLPLENRAKLEADELRKLFVWFNKVTGERQQITTCPSCVKSVLTDLIKEVKRVDLIIQG